MLCPKFIYFKRIKKIGGHDDDLSHDGPGVACRIGALIGIQSGLGAARVPGNEPDEPLATEKSDAAHVGRQHV